MTETIVQRQNKQWRVYKPNKTNNGAASRIEFKSYDVDGRREVDMFWVASPQTGVDAATKNATFAWADKESKAVVNMKLGEPDIGEILAVLNRQKKQAGGDKGIYHQNPKGNTTFSFQYVDEKGYYTVRVAAKRGDEPLVAVQHTLTHGEAQILRVLLTHAIERIYDWY